MRSEYSTNTGRIYSTVHTTGRVRKEELYLLANQVEEKHVQRRRALRPSDRARISSGKEERGRGLFTERGLYPAKCQTRVIGACKQGGEKGKEN